MIRAYGCERRCVLVLLLLLSCTSSAREAQYVEGPSSDPDTIALGFPVPAARDQAEPFAGFRSLAGLSQRMLELAAQPAGPRLSQVGTSLQQRPIEQLCFGPATEPVQVLQTGGLHAREWASPEAVLAIAEALTLEREQPIQAWLADTLPLCLIPVMNPDGLRSTQQAFARTRVCEAPEDGAPQPGCMAANATPRDGRMRRKNLRDTDGDFGTTADALLGVDLNRNLGPFWRVNNGNQASDAPQSLLYRGTARGSEPEADVLERIIAAAQPDQLRLYVDTHSFSRLYFWNCTGRSRLDQTTERWLDRMRFAARSTYAKPTCATNYIGASDELFAFELDIPAYTLELEPVRSASEYGGTGVSHDGFVLPEAIVPLMRKDAVRMAIQSYVLAAGPAWLQQVTVEHAQGTLYTGRWQNAGGERSLDVTRGSALQPGLEVQIQLQFDRPQRWRDAQGRAVSFPLPGARSGGEIRAPQLSLRAGTRQWMLDADSGQWSDTLGAYPLQVFVLDTQIPTDWDGRTPLRLELTDAELAGRSLDANPTTPTIWRAGDFDQYEPGPDSNHLLAVGDGSTPPAQGGGGSGSGGALSLLLSLLVTLRRLRGSARTTP